MSLEIIIGKNKTGKTDYIKNEYDNIKDEKILFIPAEIDFEGALSGNWGTKTKEFLPPHAKIINFLNKIIIGNEYTLNLDDDKFDQLTKNKKSIDLFIQKLQKENSNDCFFEKCFSKNLKTNDLIKNLKCEYNLILFDSQKRDGNSGSSGSLNYSLIKLLYEITFSENFKINSNYTLVIDEIEKFLHPELVFKICEMIVKISEKIKVVVTSHSPIFLERIFNIHKKNLKTNINTSVSIFYKIKYEYGKEKIFTIDNEIIEKILKEKNYRFISNFSKILFSSKIFLVEGLLDNTIINDIIYGIDELCNEYFTVIDCQGKNEIKSMYDVLHKLKIIDYYKLCLFYDTDGSDESSFIGNDNKKTFSIVNNPDLEESLFDVEIETGSGTKYIKIKDPSSKEIKIRKDKFKKEENFCFTLDWIKKSSTKEPKTLNAKINELEEKIKHFLKSK